MKITKIIASILTISIVSPVFLASAEVGGTITRSVMPIEATSIVDQMENPIVSWVISSIDKENKRLKMYNETGVYFLNLMDDTKIEKWVKAGSIIDAEISPIAIMIYPPQYTAFKITLSENDAFEITEQDWEYIIESFYWLSHNDYNQFKHIKSSLNDKYTAAIDKLVSNMIMKYSKTSSSQLSKILEKMADNVDKGIHKLTMKTPADAPMSESDTKKYNVYTYLKFKLLIESYKLSN